MSQDCDHCGAPLLDTIPDHIFLRDDEQAACEECGKPYVAQWDCDGIYFREASGPVGCKIVAPFHEEKIFESVLWMCGVQYAPV